MITPEIRMQMRRLVLADKLPVETVARRFGVHHSTVRRELVAVYTRCCRTGGVRNVPRFRLHPRWRTMPSATGAGILQALQRSASNQVPTVRLKPGNAVPSFALPLARSACLCQAVRKLVAWKTNKHDATGKSCAILPRLFPRLSR